MMLSDAGIHPLEMIGRHPNMEVIVLKGSKEKIFTQGHLETSSQRIDYEDTPVTLAMRKEVKAYNEFISGTLVEYRGQTQKNIELYRVFNDGSFTQGGRFYGPFYQGLSKSERKSLLIDGCGVSELDFKCLHGSILYARGGRTPPPDIYEVEGFERNVVKKAFLRVLNNKSKHCAIQGIVDECPEIDQDRSRLLVDKLMEKHSVISEYFFKGYALDLQYIDSLIAEHVIHHMTKGDMVCLPVHDSFLVKTCDKDDLYRLMVEGFQRVLGTGIEPRITPV
jgi:hypothetical protein